MKGKYICDIIAFNISQGLDETRELDLIHLCNNWSQIAKRSIAKIEGMPSITFFTLVQSLNFSFYIFIISLFQYSPLLLTFRHLTVQFLPFCICIKISHTGILEVQVALYYHNACVANCPSLQIPRGVNNDAHLTLNEGTFSNYGVSRCPKRPMKFR